ncbi:MAG: hypothetical protein AAF366_13625 [Pseudomonadota bacterium]
MPAHRVGCAALFALAACQPSEDSIEVEVFRPEYRGVETRLLEDDLVTFLARMEGARDNADIIDYAQCAAAQYALIRGFGFARHVRTAVTEEGGVWTADAVYVVSPEVPRGLRTIDAEVTVAECRGRGIPTV